MTKAIEQTEHRPLVLRLYPALNMTSEQFFEFCQLNRDLRIERTAKGELVIMSPTGAGTGNRNSRLNQQLANWSDKDGTGLCFDSGAGFTLPNGAELSPDAAWVKLERWNTLTQEEQEKFPPICPDFVVELCVPSDRLKFLQDKMQEYIENGASLGLLIDRKRRRVYIYRPQQPVERIDNPETVSCDPVLPGFVLNLLKIW